MKTEVIASENLDLAISLLKNGEPIAFPTETVYGLGAPVFRPEAIKRIFAIKERPHDNPLIAHVSSIDQVLLLAEDLPSSFLRLAKWFWPGPLALVVKRKNSVPSIVSAGHPTIAIRMPAHPVALRLIEGLGEPLAAHSANLSGKPSPTCPKDVLEDLDGKIRLIVDGGECQIGIESTVLSLASPRPILLRPGAIRKEELEQALGEAIDDPTKNSPLHSPGMKYRHYAPKAKVRLVFDPADLRGGYVVPQISTRTLYAELRLADRLGVDEVEILCDESVQSDTALMNRLLRASGQL